MHLVDVENLCGTGELTVEMVAAARDRYFSTVPVSANDQFYITASVANMAAVSFGWPGGEKKFKGQRDGADFLIAARISEGKLPQHFSRVVVATGDGGLTEYADFLQYAGVELDIVAVERTCAGSLKRLGAHMIYLAEDYDLAA